MKHSKRARTEFLMRECFRPRTGLFAHNGRGTAPNWINKTPTDILADINAMLELMARPRLLPMPPIELWGISRWEKLLKHPYFKFEGI
jgi:hypothetical protein